MPFDEALLEAAPSRFDPKLLEPVAPAAASYHEVSQYMGGGGDFPGPAHVPLKLPRVTTKPRPDDAEMTPLVVEGVQVGEVSRGTLRRATAIAANTAISATEGMIQPETPAIAIAAAAAPEVVLPFLTARMGKGGAQQLAEGITDLEQGRDSEGTAKIGDAITSFAFAAAPAAGARHLAGEPAPTVGERLAPLTTKAAEVTPTTPEALKPELAPETTKATAEPVRPQATVADVLGRQPGEQALTPTTEPSAVLTIESTEPAKGELGVSPQPPTPPATGLTPAEQAEAQAQLEAEVPAAQPVTAEERGKPAESRAISLAMMSPQEAIAYKQKTGGGDVSPMDALRWHYGQIMQAFRDKTTINYEAASKYEPDIPGSTQKLSQWLEERGYVREGDFLEYKPKTPEAPAAQPPETPAAPAPVAKAQAEAPTPLVEGEGPGAAPRGFGPYPAVQQLTDRLNAQPPTGVKERLSLGQRIADAWSEGKSAVLRAFASSRNVTATLKDMARGVREPKDIDSRIGEFDYAIQSSSGMSANAGRAIQRQMPNATDRAAAALLIESAHDPKPYQDALPNLPADTKASVRRAVERAANPSPELVSFAKELELFYGIRENDAVASDLFEEGLRDYYTHIWKREADMPASLRDATANGRLNTYFQFGRQRTIPTLLEGILEGREPLLDPAKVVPYYNFVMDRAIASREFIFRLAGGAREGAVEPGLKASDGRPLVEPAGGAVVVDPADTGAVLVTPKLRAEEMRDYKPIDNPSMQKWKWVTTTPDGRTVLMRGELMAHPEAHERLARFLDRGRLTPGPKMAKALAVSREVKGLKLGFLPSAFHQVHVGLHAAFHWTRPFAAKAIDWEAPFTRFAIEKGHLKLAPDARELSAFSEGMGASRLVSKFPILGQWANAYTHWLFTDYIPRLKLATFENAWMRARSTGFAIDAGGVTFPTTTGRALRRGALSEDAVAARLGDAVNNAYGELNHLFLGKFGRDPAFQRMLQLAFLAPDFGEARLRFAEKALTRYGTEERIALLTMAGTLYAAARIGNWLSHGNAEADDYRRMFSVKVGDHWYSVRSVLGDVIHAFERPGQFAYVRLNPLYSRTASDLLLGRDVATGQKLDATDKLNRVWQQLVPIPLQGLTEDNKRMWESFMASQGLSPQRDNPVADIYRLAAEWEQKKGIKPAGETIPTGEPSYQKLRTALNIGATSTARAILDDLLKTHTLGQVSQAMNDYAKRPFTGTRQHEAAFVASLTPREKQRYREAVDSRVATVRDFAALLRARQQSRFDPALLTPVAHANP